MKKAVLVWLAWVGVFAAQAQWIDTNPGAGGQVQGLDPDPNTPGTVYFSSDVEGNYRSDDNGEHWTYIGYELRCNMSFGVTVEPGNSNRVYASTCCGLHISDNKGTNWPGYVLGGYPLSKVVVNPANPNQVFALIGFRYKNQVPVSWQNNQSNALLSGRRLLFRSNDKGVTWDSLQYEPVNGYRNTYSLDIDPNNPGTLYLGAASGLYKSTDYGTTWVKMTQPAGTFNCYGAALTPDGGHLYVSFATVNDPSASSSQTTTTTRMYATRTDVIAWQEVNGNGFNLGTTNPATGAQTAAFNGAWWTPKVDPRSTATQHKVLIGTASNARQGLYEGTFTWAGNSSPTSYSWQRVFYRNGSVNPGPSAAFAYDTGWEDVNPGCQTFNYTPASWPERGIWTTGLQNYFYASTSTPNFPYDSWQNKHSVTVSNDGTSNETYRTKGTACTVNYDGTGLNNYGIHGQADNGVLESWDNGASWATQSRPGTSTQTEAVEIANIGPGKTPIVLAHGIPSAFGGGGTTGSLYAKRLVNFNTSDVWAQIAAGANNRAGLIARTIFDIAVDPSDTKRVFLGQLRTGTPTSTGGGVSFIPDIEAFYTANAVVPATNSASAPAGQNVQDITVAPLGGGPDAADIDGNSVSSLAVDPNNGNVLYATVTSGVPGLYRGVLTSGVWLWTRVISGGVNEVCAWNYGGVTFLAIRGNLPAASVPGAPAGQGSVALSNDGGSTWSLAMTADMAETTRPLNWHDAATRTLNSGALIGYGDKVYVGWHSFGYNKGYGLFEGKLVSNASTAITWSDWTGDLHFPRVRRIQIVKNTTDNKVWMYVATQGTGAWKRDITPVVIDTQPADGAFCEGSTATFTVAATGTTPLTYQWYKGTPGSGTLLTGQESATLTLNPVQESDEGSYYCLVSGVSTETTSNAATMTVNPLPAVPTAPVNQTICQGQTIPPLSVSVGSGETVDWYSAATGGDLLLSGSLSYTPTVAGTFYAQARNTSSGCVSSSRTTVTLTIKPLPTASVSGSTTICSGTGTSIAFSGTAGATVVYTVNGGNQTLLLDGNGSASLPTGTLTTNTTYALVSASLDGCGQPQSSTATVTLTPNAFGGPLTVSGAPVCAGQNLTLTFAFTCPEGVTFTAQLSDPVGSFANPTTLPAVTPGSNTLPLPASLPTGTAYRIRLLTANPTLTPLVSEPFRVNALNGVMVALFPATPGGICQGEALPVTFSTTGACSFPVDNVFTVQLSSSTGSFANPTVLGTALPGTTLFPASLLAGLPVGNGYRVRILSSNPAQTSQASAPFRLEGPSLNVTPGVGGVPVCRGNQVTVSFSLPNGSCAFPEGNQFTAQLSSGTGSFTSLIELGVVTPGQATALTIPATVAAGTGYRIRVVSTTPALTSPSSLPFRVNACANRVSVEEARLVAVPNPSSGGVIRCRVSGMTSPIFGLTSAAGVRVRMVVKADAPGQYLVIPGNHLPSGVYVLEATEGRTRLSQRVIVAE